MIQIISIHLLLIIYLLPSKTTYCNIASTSTIGNNVAIDALLLDQKPLSSRPIVIMLNDVAIQAIYSGKFHLF